MNTLKWRKIINLLLLYGVLAVASGLAYSQEASEGTRKILSRPAPRYPVLARKMNISGAVKIDAVIGPNGTVKSVAVKGGHPVLAQAAQDAVRDWKWEPAAHETHELIEVKFDNPQ